MWNVQSDCIHFTNTDLVVEGLLRTQYVLYDASEDHEEHQAGKDFSLASTVSPPRLLSSTCSPHFLFCHLLKNKLFIQYNLLRVAIIVTQAKWPFNAGGCT